MFRSAPPSPSCNISSMRVSSQLFRALSSEIPCGARWKSSLLVRISTLTGLQTHTRCTRFPFLSYLARSAPTRITVRLPFSPPLLAFLWILSAPSTSRPMPPLPSPNSASHHPAPQLSASAVAGQLALAAVLDECIHQKCPPNPSRSDC